MSELIRALLAFSRVATHGNPIQQVDLNEILADVLSDLEIALSESGGRVLVDHLPSIQADPVQMRQLFQNLVSNALKFSQKDAAPVLHVHGWIEQRDRGSSNDSTEEVHLEVKDNGIGFEEKYLDRIFAPFQRLHGKSAYPGTGIGLAICRRIVERHGGTITAHSIPGDGSTFVITLPVHHVTQPDAMLENAG